MTELELSLLKAERDAARASARQWKARAHLFRLRARDEKSAHRRFLSHAIQNAKDYAAMVEEKGGAAC